MAPRKMLYPVGCRVMETLTGMTEYKYLGVH